MARVSPPEVGTSPLWPAAPLPSRDVFVVTSELVEADFPSFRDAVIDGIADVIGVMGLDFRVRQFGSRWSQGDYGSTEWFINRAVATRVNLGQRAVEWSQLRHDLEVDPSRVVSPHLGHMIMDSYIIKDGALPFAVTNIFTNQTVQSIASFANLKEPEPSSLSAIRHIAKHEFGHNLGLSAGTIKNPDKRPGPANYGHCGNACVMHQTRTVKEAVSLAADLEGKPRAGFCSDCTEFITSR